MFYDPLLVADLYYFIVKQIYQMLIKCTNVSYRALAWDGLKGSFAAFGFEPCKCACQRRDGREGLPYLGAFLFFLILCQSNYDFLQ
jgi:hypothetical protein